MLHLIQKILGRPERRGSELFFFCPKCKHDKKKLSVNLKKNKFHCWICNYGGNDLGKIVLQYGKEEDKRQLPQFNQLNKIDELIKRLQGKEEDKEIVLPEDFRLLSPKMTAVNMNALRYLHSRMISQSDIMIYRMGFSLSGKYKDRIIIPSFDAAGSLNGFVARSFTESFPPYLAEAPPKKMIFNELLVNWNDPVILVEGVFDAIIAGTNAIPLLGSSLSIDSLLFRRIVERKRHIFLGLDPDAESKQRKIANLFFDHDISVSFIEVKPYKDIGKMTKEEFQKRFERSKKEVFSTRLQLVRKQYAR